MKLETRNFGEIEILEEDIIDFKDGLPGFPKDRRFVLLSEDDSPVSFLQSVDGGDVSFVVVDMLAFMPDYNPRVDENFIQDLGTFEPANFLIFNIATIFDNLKESTVNLKAPIVVNAVEKKGKQVVCENEEYSVKDALFGHISADAVSQDEGGEIC
jgi:flagellar assembly factor FliW